MRRPRLEPLASREVRRVVGLQSGTSLDGVDAVLARLEGERPRVEFRAIASRPFPDDLRARLLAATAGEARVREVAELHAELGRRYVEAAETLLAAADPETPGVDLVACPGQTVHHRPRADGGPLTFQIGEASSLAEALGCPVVRDLRSRDVAAGGDGAPLVPLADRFLFARADERRVILNIGGMANVTVLRGDDPDGVSGFDVGPGNVLIDAAVTQVTDGERTFDEDGLLAARGRVVPDLLEELLAHPFLDREPPRSTGRETFGPDLVAAIRADRPDLDPPDLVRTLTRFTAGTVADALDRFVDGRADLLLVAGGGARNPLLLDDLAELCAPVPVRTTAEACGIPVEAREALAFAVLADRTVRGLPGNVPAATGARHPVVCGTIVPS